MPGINGAGLISALATPYTNYAGESAARSERLQLGQLLTDTAEKEVTEEAAAAAQQEAFMAQLRRKPLVGNDVSRLKAHMRGVQKELVEKLASDRYKGSLRKMMKAEGATWMADTQAELEESGWYKQAIQNKEQVVAAQAALAKGDVLVGQDRNGKYRRGEDDLYAFLGGKSDSYTMRGAYKREDDLKELRNQYAPNKMPWERTAVSEDDKLAHLVNLYGAEVGRDKYLRQHVGIPTYYKTDSMLDKMKFDMDRTRLGMEQQRLNMAWQTQRESMRLHAQQRELNDLKIKEKKAELNGEGPGGQPFDYGMLSRPTTKIKLVTDDKGRKLPHSGVNLGQIRELGGTTLFGDAEQLMANQLGLGKVKGGYTKGSIKEGFTTANGAASFDLSRSNFQVTGVDPHVYYNTADVGTNPKQGLRPGGVMGYGQVTVHFNSHADAEKAGMYDEGLIWNSDTRGGSGVYDPATMSATLLVPMGNIDRRNNAVFMRQQQINAAGKKAASEEPQPYIPNPIGYSR